MTVKLRCAIYTRKSSEEGLDQNFNSLHAQREACEAYVLSQTGEGWTAIKTAYDDGGYSGGSMDRPGLKQLLADIGQGLVDIVVVYKVDRLTRSLADFAKIVELFDAKGVSFVSVTQAFNTTSSMGRLTLNVLLSFAQFEREVTGERIRDKVAASKAKGLRMGGRPPLGYDIADGRLVVNAAEASRVVEIFERYLASGSIHALEKQAVLGKAWVNRRGESVGGGALSRGALHYLLTNPVYLGVTRHKDRRYEDTHPAVVERELWNRVQAKLADTNTSQPKTELRGEGAILEGLVFDDNGHPMAPVHTKRGATRYRYYVSRPSLTRSGKPGSLHRIAAGMLEQFLVARLEPVLASRWLPEAEASQRLTAALTKVVLSDDHILIEAHRDAIAQPIPAALQAMEAGDQRLQMRIDFHMRRRQGALILEPANSAPAPAAKVDRTLVRAVVLARRWMAELEEGTVSSIASLAARENLCSHYTARMLPLAYLAPDLAEKILAGRQPRAVTLGALIAQPLPADWVQQRSLFNQLGSC